MIFQLLQNELGSEQNLCDTDGILVEFFDNPYAIDLPVAVKNTPKALSPPLTALQFREGTGYARSKTFRSWESDGKGIKILKESKMKRITILVVLMLLMASFAFATGTQEATADSPLKLVLLVKSLGNGFFEACADGGEEAAAELGNVDSIYMGPSASTAEGQIEIIETLIAQKVDGIAISANDRNALIPVAKKAMKAGVTIISFDSGIAVGGRTIDLVPSKSELIGRQQVQLIAELCDYKGKVGIVSSTSQATNQNLWIEWMYEEIKKPEYADMELVEVVYGDDSADKSYREAVGLMQKYPDLAGIISPTTIGILASSKAIEDEGKKGVVQLTGLGLPSEMQYYVENGLCGQMALWNPIDLGYASTYILEALVTGKIEGKEGEAIKVGRMDDITIGKDGLSVMGAPFVFNKDNIVKFATMF